jgi:hypothetical protein
MVQKAECGSIAHLARAGLHKCRVTNFCFVAPVIFSTIATVVPCMYKCVSLHPPSSRHHISAVYRSFQNCVCMELASCHPPGSKNLEVPPRSEGNLWTPVPGPWQLNFGITLVVAPELKIAVLPKTLMHLSRRKQKMSARYDSGGTGGQYVAVLRLPQEFFGGALCLHRHVMGDHYL